MARAKSERSDPYIEGFWKRELYIYVCIVCMYIYICMYVCMYVCVYVCVCYHAEVGRIWDFQTCSRFSDVFF